MKRGEQKRIPTPGQQRHYHVFGAYDWSNHTVTWTTSKRKHSAAFITFLERLLVERYPDEVVVLVLDNASIHKSAASMAALSLFEHRVWVFWLPPYCSTLNPIERFWRHLKDQMAANTLHPDMETLLAAIEKRLVAQNDMDNSERFAFS